VSQYRIPLIKQPYGNEEILESIDSLISGNVTMGKKVKQFEQDFAKYIGMKHAIMVNSGSSANLLALEALVAQGRLKKGDEIITPAVTWATTVFPIANVGAVPVIVDVELDTFDINPKEIEKAITPKTKAIMLVHLLGNPCKMQEIIRIALQNNLIIIEDACESHGAEYYGKKTGSFGEMSTFSFYYSHHITTIEGGMILTNNDTLSDLLKSLRVFGWIRELDSKDIISRQYPDLNPMFLFLNVGYCFRPTEIQGAFGIHQLKKLDNFVEIRRKNAEYLNSKLKKYDKYLQLHLERDNTKHCWFGYPITIKSNSPFARKNLIAHLEEAGIETRPIMTGNIVCHPAMTLIDYKFSGPLSNADVITNNSFFFGNHQGICFEDLDYIVDTISSFMDAQ
jgi:CDP-4-dehydro-6-deoxyglucose reductase, E1